MKITAVDVMRVPSGNTGITRGDWSPVLARIRTDEGIYGWGEAGLAFGKGWRAGFGMILDFAEEIIGEDPMNIERIWERLFRRTFWGLGGGTVIYAGISALDIALWDIKGKAMGVPVWQLLGGRTNERIRAYASQLQFNWGEQIEKEFLTAPEEYARAAEKAMAEGYTAVKVDPVQFSDRPDGRGDWRIRGPLENRVIRTARERIRAIREAGGPDLDIILENHGNTDTVSAIQLGQALEEYRIFYYEEPVHSQNPQNMREVQHRVNIPVAAGERIYTRNGYRPFLEDRSIQVVQPDVCLCGGITETKKICDMANTYDCAVQVHVCGSPISKAAALQIEAVVPNVIIHEHHQRALDPVGRATCVADYQPEQGYMRIPDGPGIGQEPTLEILAQCRMETVSRERKYFYSFEAEQK